jgi:putative ABC transport system substrate-binding protein
MSTRREFVTLLGGAAAWPISARAQQAERLQAERLRHVAVLLPATADNPVFQSWVAAFFQGLALLGWTVGRNLRVETRWATTDPVEIRRHTSELAALGPEAILAHGTSTLTPLLQATRSVPIVFAVVADPIGAGIVQSLARPGGNATGFMNFDYSMGAKWLELMKEIAPEVTRVAVLRDAAAPSGIAAFSVIQAVAPFLRVDVTPVNIDADEIERQAAGLSPSPKSGLILTPSNLAQRHGKLIVTVAAQRKLAAVYFERSFVAALGGLVSYGPDFLDQYRRAAGYVDRILKGEKPADLPVQAPTKYELVINLNTARQIGIEIPPTLLARADEVIE